MIHWADRTADALIAERPDVEVYTCASGISPSGSIHIGNVRDIATILFVGRALRDRGKRVRLIHSWDEYDRLRKIPRPKTAADAGLPSWLEERARRMQIPESFEEHLGRPLASVPDPLGEFPSYADRFEKEFVTQGEHENRSIYDSLAIGWNLLTELPRGELKRVKGEHVEKYLPKK